MWEQLRVTWHEQVATAQISTSENPARRIPPARGRRDEKQQQLQAREASENLQDGELAGDISCSTEALNEWQKKDEIFLTT